MPIYEYKCQSCGHEFEEIVKFSDEPPMCPECDSVTERCMSKSSGFRLKGDGWAKHGYSKHVGDQPGYPKEFLNKK